MADLKTPLNEKSLVAYDQHELLSHNFGGFADEFFKNHVQNSKVQNEYGRCYSIEMKQFGMTLHYYSPKAYYFVRMLTALPILLAYEHGLCQLTVNLDISLTSSNSLEK